MQRCGVRTGNDKQAENAKYILTSHIILDDCQKTTVTFSLSLFESKTFDKS